MALAKNCGCEWCEIVYELISAARPGIPRAKLTPRFASTTPRDQETAMAFMTLMRAPKIHIEIIN
jgi:hypothetical protein